MVSVCPHCLSRVLVKADGSCPSCGEPITQEDLAALEGFTTQTVDEGSPLPGSCFLCDGLARRFVKFHVPPGGSSVVASDAMSRSAERMNALAKLALFLAGAIFGKILFFDPRSDPGLGIVLPSCERCFERARSLKPLDVSYSNRSMTFLVHRNFPQRLSEAAKARGAP